MVYLRSVLKEKKQDTAEERADQGCCLSWNFASSLTLKNLWSMTCCRVSPTLRKIDITLHPGSISHCHWAQLQVKSGEAVEVGG